MLQGPVVLQPVDQVSKNAFLEPIRKAQRAHPEADASKACRLARIHDREDVGSPFFVFLLVDLAVAKGILEGGAVSGSRSLEQLTQFRAAFRNRLEVAVYIAGSQGAKQELLGLEFLRDRWSYDVNTLTVPPLDPRRERERSPRTAPVDRRQLRLRENGPKRARWAPAAGLFSKASESRSEVTFSEAVSCERNGLSIRLLLCSTSGGYAVGILHQFRSVEVLSQAQAVAGSPSG